MCSEAHLRHVGCVTRNPVLVGDSEHQDGQSAGSDVVEIWKDNTKMEAVSCLRRLFTGLSRRKPLFQSQDLAHKFSGGQGYLLVSVIQPTDSLDIHSSITDAA